VEGDWRRALSALESAAACTMPRPLLAPLVPWLDRWDAEVLPRRPSLGRCGAVLSVHLGPDGAGDAIRCDVDPLWELDEPATVHEVAAALAEKCGADPAPLSALLSWSAWPPPGVGPGPYIGVSAGGRPSVRAWTPSLTPNRVDGALLERTGVTAALEPALAGPLGAGLSRRFAGIEVDGGGVRKLSLYLQASGVPALRSARLSGAAAALLSALEGGPVSYSGMALRAAPGDGEWRRVVEAGMHGVSPALVARWLADMGWTRSAELIEGCAAAGLHLSTVAVVDGEGAKPAWVAAYWATRDLPLATGRGVPRVGVPAALPGESELTGGLAQSVIDWRGAIHTCSWRGGERRWSTIATPPGEGMAKA
jgi:hypothetical protein